jgi:probable DNA repair protein
MRSRKAAPTQQQLILDFGSGRAAAQRAEQEAPGPAPALLNELLDAGCIVLTQTRQLAHILNLEYARHAQRDGRAAWRTPQLLPLGAWLRAQWVINRGVTNRVFANEAGHIDSGMAQAAGHLRLLSATQARVVWEQVIDASEQAEELLDVVSAAQSAARSWRRLHEYLIPVQRLEGYPSAEARALHGWVRQFEQRLEALGAIDEAQLAEQAFQQQWLPERPAALVGFDVLTPALRRLLDLWQAQGRLASCVAAGAAHEVHVLAATDARAELEMAARWSRARLEAGTGSVGIVIGELDARRAEVIRVFADVFAPGNAAIGTAQSPVPVAVAAPAALATHPCVAAAVLCLRLLRGSVDSVLVGRVLRTPFIAAGLSERETRALADARLREEQRGTWDLPLLERWAAMTGCQQLQLHVAQAVALARGMPSRQVPSAWAATFNATLLALGWPGERTLDSVEYQTERKFHAALGELGTLDEVLGSVTLGAALVRFEALLNDTPFEAEVQPGAVHVLDASFTAGLQFDALWVLGLDATHLPGALNPDPLIPLELQRAAHMPQASPQQWLQLAQSRLQQLTCSAATVVLSWPQSDGEAQLQPSALLNQWSALNAAQLRQSDVRSRAQQLFEARPSLERLFDERAPRLLSVGARGGARILELQSACPFRAQAELRLEARPLASVQFGMGLLERGRLLHRVLAQLWAELKSQQQLRERPATLLEARVREITQQHAARVLRADTPLRTRLLQLEVDYTVQQTLRLLAIERERAAFAVRATEQGGHIAIGGLSIAWQPDRLDDLAAGGQLLIDYKLGAGYQPAQWLDTHPGRPRRPQLPLYALANPAAASALAFVVLAPGKVEFRGWSEQDTGIPGIEAYPPKRLRTPGPPNWQGLLQHWHEVLTHLAEQFVAGHAVVDPLPRECNQCHLQSLCRVHEQAPLVQYDLDFEDD